MTFPLTLDEHPLGPLIPGANQPETAQELDKLANEIAVWIADPKVMDIFRTGVRMYCLRLRKPRRDKKAKSESWRWRGIIDNRLSFPLPKREFKDFEKITLLATIYDARSVGGERIFPRSENMPFKEYLFRMPYSYHLVDCEFQRLLEEGRVETTNVVRIARRFLDELQAISSLQGEGRESKPDADESNPAAWAPASEIILQYREFGLTIHKLRTIIKNPKNQIRWRSPQKQRLEIHIVDMRAYAQKTWPKRQSDPAPEVIQQRARAIRPPAMIDEDD